MRSSSPTLESAISTVDLSEHRRVDWNQVRVATYLIHQQVGYTYPGPIRQLQQSLVIVPPPQHGDQRLIDHRFTVTEQAATTTYRSDAFGNTEIGIQVPSVERQIEFEAWILVERQLSAETYYLQAPDCLDDRYRLPSRLTRPDVALTDAAARLTAGGKRGIELANAINDLVHQSMRYVHDVTDVHTTATQAFALKQGVCQDYAHVMLALCRLCRLPARYVSGHLLGDGGTHAWVEVLLFEDDDSRGARIVALDPTHGRPASMKYLTVAVGRDYFDVAPTSGTYLASYHGQLSTHKRVRLASYE